MNLILMVFAFVLFIIAFVTWHPYVEGYRVRLVAGGLAFWSAALIFGQFFK